jgi:hypothetical protein
VSDKSEICIPSKKVCFFFLAPLSGFSDACSSPEFAQISLDGGQNITANLIVGGDGANSFIREGKSDALSFEFLCAKFYLLSSIRYLFQTKGLQPESHCVFSGIR